MLFQIDNTNVRLAASMHLIPRGRRLPDWVEINYRWSAALWLEHDIQAFQPYTLLPAGQTAEHLFPQEVWQRLSAAWPAKLGPLAQRKPWIIPPTLALSNVQLDPGVELLLTQLAISEGRPIRYLETPSEFATLADAISNALIAEGITWVLDNPTVAGGQIDAMYDAWAGGDLDRLTRLFLAAPLMRSQEARQALIDERNRLWAPRITNLIQTAEPTMIAVGAGHLGGDNGLVRLLTLAGHDLHRLV